MIHVDIVFSSALDLVWGGELEYRKAQAGLEPTVIR